MEKLLTKKGVRTSVDATTENEKFKYEVNYMHQNGVLEKVSCNIHALENNEYSGYMSFESGRANFNFPLQDDMKAHVAIFEQLFNEIKEDLKQPKE